MIQNSSKNLSELVLPKFIGDKMVLQRGVSVPIWGWAPQGALVTVSFAGQTKQATPNDKGKWVAWLDPMEASAENRTMTISSVIGITLKDILVGEVWLASGQSNMEWAFSEIAEEERAYAASHIDNPLVRSFHVERYVRASVPTDDTIGRWKDCSDMVGEPALHAGNQRGVSAMGFFFALKLSEKLGVPVAFIDATWGGMPIECFIPKEGFEAVGLDNDTPPALDFEKVKQRLREAQTYATESLAALEQGRILPFPFIEEIFGYSGGQVYNAMIAPLLPARIKGVIWYQGEQNRNVNELKYFEKLHALHIGWSQAFEMKDMPLHIAQIAPFDYLKARNNEGPSRSSTLCDRIWAAQYKAALEIPGVNIVPTHDTGVDVNDIHPKHKLTISNRLAAVALREQYQIEGTVTGPRVRQAQRRDQEIIISFDCIDKGLTTRDGQDPSWFEVSTDGWAFVHASARIEGDAVIVSSPDIAEPALVRMGWYDTAIPNLMDKNGWPAFAFPALPVESST